VSAQTGTTSLPPPPRSEGLLGLMRFQLGALTRNPNPVFMRELRAAARLPRTPFILSVVAGMMALLLCSVGGIAAISAEPARVGSWLYQTFFSLTFALVTWMGPSVAASTIAAERSGRTWEALELTGLGPASIARGKFLAAFTYVALYLVMLAPVGAVPFLFGGVTALEVLSAFALLALFTAFSVAFGLAMSSKFQSPSLAILVTLLVTVPVSIAAYLGLGVGLSFAAGQLWSSVYPGTPVWLPSTYVRADLNVDYLVLLVLGPLSFFGLSTWLFYEVTIANMAAPSDDRSTRLRIWTLVAGPSFTMVLAASAASLGTTTSFLGAQGLLFVFYLTLAFLILGEPLGPSRRVEVHFERRRASAVRRFFGPGVIQASSCLLLLTVFSFSVLTFAGVLGAGGRDESNALVGVGGYGLCFLTFVFGFAAFTRAGSRTPGVPRVLLLGALFLAFVGPWIAMAIAGIFEESGQTALLMAAPSPIFAVRMAEVALDADPIAGVTLSAGALSAAAWALIGLGLYAVAASRVRKRRAEEQRLRTRLETPPREATTTPPPGAPGPPPEGAPSGAS
jgi:hypothetical protein